MLSKDQRGAKLFRRLPHQAGVVDVQLYIIFVAEIKEDWARDLQA